MKRSRLRIKSLSQMIPIRIYSHKCYICSSCYSKAILIEEYSATEMIGKDIAITSTIARSDVGIIRLEYYSAVATILLYQVSDDQDCVSCRYSDDLD